MSDDNYTAKATTTAHDYHPLTPDWSPGFCRQSIKAVLVKGAKQIGGEVTVFALSDNPPGFMACVTQGTSMITFTFRFAHWDDEQLRERGASVECESVGDWDVMSPLMDKLEGMVCRVPMVNKPEVVPAPRKSERDSMGRPLVGPFPVKLVKNGNGKFIGTGDCFDNSRGNTVFTGKRRIGRAKGAKVRPPMGAAPRGTAYMPGPLGIPGKPKLLATEALHLERVSPGLYKACGSPLKGQEGGE